MNDRINVKQLGAIGNGITKDTKAIQQAIDLCNHQGGGEVILEGGIFLCGGLYLKSNVTIKIEGSATLLASGDIEDYGDDTHYNRYRNEKDMDRCFLFAQDAENISLCGTGKIDGNAEAFPNKNSKYRPMMIRFLRCHNLRISSLCLYNAAAWTTAFLDSSFLWIEGVDIRNEKRYNGDGLDFDGCEHVFVSNCYLKGTDDNLCLQAGNKERPMRNVHISNCEFSSICAGIRIGLKSIGTISNVVIENCTMKNIWREGIKIECTEGGNIFDIVVKGIVMQNVRRPIFVLLNNQFQEDGLGSSIELSEMPEIGSLKNLVFSDMIMTDDQEMEHTHFRFQDDVMGSPRFNGIRFDAAKEFPIENVVIKNVFYTAIGGVGKKQIPQYYPKVLDCKQFPKEIVSSNYYPDWSRATFMDIRNVKKIILDDIILESIHADEREKVILEDCVVLKNNIVS